MEQIGGLKFVDFMNRLFFIFGLLTLTINSYAQLSTTELIINPSTASSTSNGRIRYNSACNCFVFRYGGANVTPPLVAAPGAGQAGQSVRWNNGTTSWEYFTPTASQGSALSVWGVAGNSVADNASIVAASDKQIMRREGTALAFGSIDLSASGAVGSSILGIANGGTGSSTALWWPLTGTGTFTGNTTIAQGSNTLSHTYTSVAGTTIPYTFTSSITATANSQAMVAFDFNTTFANGGFTSTTNTGLKVRTGRVGFGLGATNPSAALHVRSEGTTSSTNALVIQDSGGDNMFRILDDGFIRLGSNGSPPNIGPTATGTSLSKSGAGIMLTTNTVGTTIECTAPATTGTIWKLRIHGTNAPVSSSTAEFINLYFTPTYNFSNGGTITVTGLDYNPTETDLTGVTHYGIRQRSTTALSGFATSTPVSTLETGRSFGAAITSTSSDITLDASHYTLQVDATGANRTETLPAASTCTRRIYVILKIDASANTVTIDGNGGETISGAATQVITTQWKGYMIQSTGSAWVIISAF